MVLERAARDFLRLNRVALIGASDGPEKFSNSIYRELKGHGYDVVAVNPNVDRVDGDPCYSDLALVTPPVNGAIVMVAADKAARAVQDYIDVGIDSVWLFKGFGPNSVSPEALALCESNGVRVVAGACPLMFLEPVAWGHRVHRSMRHLTGSLQA
jgi:uncharacterized protein